MKQRIYNLLAQRPMTVTQIFDALYGSDPNGGPESDNIVRVHVTQMNKRLLEKGLRIRGDGGTYRIESVAASPEDIKWHVDAAAALEVPK